MLRPALRPPMRAPMRSANAPSEGVGVATRTLDLAGAELVTNGQFTSDIASWTDSSSAGGAIAWNAGALRITNTSGTARARQPVSVTTGRRYAYGVQNVGSPSVAGSIALGTTAGGTDYLTISTNPSIAQRLGIAEFTATAATAHIQVSAPLAGALDWDCATLRELIETEFATGTTFEDDFTGDGPVLGRLTPDGLPWRLIANTNATQVVPTTAGGKMVVTPNASGGSASYPYLDLGTGKASGIHCDLSWTGAGSMAMVSVAKTGARLTIANILANSLHIVFTDTKVDITKYVGGVVTTDTITYAAPVATDGTVYPDVGWFLDGSTVTVKMPDGTTAQRTDSDFALVAGGCAIAEHFYNSPPTGGISNDKVAVRLG